MINSDISSAAQGALSSSPSGVYPHQNIPYPCTKYYFDKNIFFGIDANDLLVEVLKSPVMLPAGADSHLRRSSLISAAAVADVDALTISPAVTTAASAAAIVSNVSLSILYSHHRIYSMNSYFFVNYMNSYSNANILIHIILYGMNSYSPF